MKCVRNPKGEVYRVADETAEALMTSTKWEPASREAWKIQGRKYLDILARQRAASGSRQKIWDRIDWEILQGFKHVAIQAHMAWYGSDLFEAKQAIDDREATALQGIMFIRRRNGGRDLTEAGKARLRRLHGKWPLLKTVV